MNASNSSFPTLVENALVVTVLMLFGWSPDTTASITGGVDAVFDTVTPTAVDVVMLFFASRARAANVWVVFVAVVAFPAIVHWAGRTSPPHGGAPGPDMQPDDPDVLG